MNYIGIDPGMRLPGVAVLDEKAALVHAQVVREPAGRDPRLPRAFRIHRVTSKMMEVIVPHLDKGESVVGVEGPAYKKWGKSQSMEQMAMCRQAIYDACVYHLDDFIHFEVAPSRAKQAATGNGSATKDQVARTVEQAFMVSLPRGKNDRYAVADAISVALGARSRYLEEGGR